MLGSQKKILHCIQEFNMSVKGTWPPMGCALRRLGVDSRSRRLLSSSSDNIGRMDHLQICRHTLKKLFCCYLKKTLFLKNYNVPLQFIVG